jgi:acetoacetyl-CoA synthetase
MLATTSIGAVWSSCSPDFGTNSVLDRFGQIEPKVLFACDGYYHNGKTIDCREKMMAIANALDSTAKVVSVPVLDLSVPNDKSVVDWRHTTPLRWLAV